MCARSGAPALRARRALFAVAIGAAHTAGGNIRGIPGEECRASALYQERSDEPCDDPRRSYAKILGWRESAARAAALHYSRSSRHAATIVSKACLSHVCSTLRALVDVVVGRKCCPIRAKHVALIIYRVTRLPCRAVVEYALIGTALVCVPCGTSAYAADDLARERTGIGNALVGR